MTNNILSGQPSSTIASKKKDTGAAFYLPEQSCGIGTTASAAENMALDMSMLADNTNRELLFRSYNWSEPTATFGYNQSLSAVKLQTSKFGAAISLQRRPTGGGIVDHRNDWTYALAIPASHAMAKVKPLDLYHIVHQALARSLREVGIDAAVAADAGCKAGLTCFVKPMRYDVVDGTGLKLAGAALKRTRDGVLLQGSVLIQDFHRPLAATFPDQLSIAMGNRLTIGLPALLCKSSAFSANHRRFASSEWNQLRA